MCIVLIHNIKQISNFYFTIFQGKISLRICRKLIKALPSRVKYQYIKTFQAVCACAPWRQGATHGLSRVSPSPRCEAQSPPASKSVQGLIFPRHAYCLLLDLFKMSLVGIKNLYDKLYIASSLVNVVSLQSWWWTVITQQSAP